MKVLIVDDEAPMRQLMRRFLCQDFDLEFREADDGATALELLLKEPVDLVILDLRMRVMDGMETLDALRQSDRFAALPVALVTGQAEATSVDRALALGVSSIIVKPFTRESLRDRLQGVLARAAKPPAPVVPTVPRLEILPSQRILVVDRDPAFREAIVPVLQRLARVDDIANEFTALTRCLDGPRPDILVVGEVSELSSLEGVARKARSIPGPHPIAIVAALPPDAVDVARTGRLFDQVFARSLKHEVVAQGIVDALTAAGAERLLMHPTSPVILEVFDGLRAELAQPGSFTFYDAPPETPSEARGVRADVRLTGTHSVYDLRVFVPLPIALRVAGAKLNLRPDMVSDAGVMAETEGLLREATTRLQAKTARYRWSLDIGSVQTEIVDGLAEVAGTAANRAGTRKWLATSVPHPVVVTLSSRPLADGA